MLHDNAGTRVAPTDDITLPPCSATRLVHPSCGSSFDNVAFIFSESFKEELKCRRFDWDEDVTAAVLPTFQRVLCKSVNRAGVSKGCLPQRSWLQILTACDPSPKTLRKRFPFEPVPSVLRASNLSVNTSRHLILNHDEVWCLPLPNLPSYINVHY